MHCLELRDPRFRSGVHGRSNRGVVKRLFAFVSLAIAVVLLSGGAFRAYRQHRIESQTEIDPRKGISEEGFVPIGGIEQWVSIRGADRKNPVLLLLHGGP